MATIYVGCQRAEDAPDAQSNREVTRILNDPEFIATRSKIERIAVSHKWSIERGEVVVTNNHKVKEAVAAFSSGSDNYSKLYIFPKIDLFQKDSELSEGLSSITHAILVVSNEGVLIHGILNGKPKTVSFIYRNKLETALRNVLLLQLNPPGLTEGLSRGFIKVEFGAPGATLSELRAAATLGVYKVKFAALNSRSKNSSVSLRTDQCQCPPPGSPLKCSCAEGGGSCTADCSGNQRACCGRTSGGGISCNCCSPTEDC